MRECVCVSMSVCACGSLVFCFIKGLRQCVNSSHVASVTLYSVYISYFFLPVFVKHQVSDI